MDLEPRGYACGKVGHFARGKVRPARGKTCAKCGQKGRLVVRVILRAKRVVE